MQADGTLDGAWDAVARQLRKAIGARTFDQWLGQLSGLRFDAQDQMLTLAFPTRFVASYVETHYAARLLLAWRQALPDLRAIRCAASDAPASSIALPAPVVVPERAAASAAPQGGAMRFANFVVGDANRVAAAAAQSVVSGGPMRFSPLFIHAPTGQGKTHLLNAMAQAFAEEGRGEDVLLLSAERFMVDFVMAVRNRDTLAFKQRLRSVQLLLVDDFQFIAGKATTQEEFLHTIDTLMSDGRQLVITADRPPQELDGVEGRLLSRLTQGLVVDIRPADYPLRRAILERKAQGLGVAVPEAVLDLLARRIASSVRELEGGLNRLVAYATLNDRACTVEFAEEILANAFAAGRRKVTIDEIQKRVAEHFGIRHAEMVSARRSRNIARPRQVAMYLAKQLTPRSLPEIGRRFGGRDHTTVIHAVRQVERLRGIDGELDSAVKSLIRQLES